MAAIEMRPLQPRQREFIELMVYKGLSKEESYAQAYGIPFSETPLESLRTKASRVFYLPHVNNYYHALMEEVRDREVGEAVWTKEMATKKLMKLIERAEEDIYGIDSQGNATGEKKQLTMGRLNAIVLPVKELNTMNGLNTTSNVNIEGCVVKIIGEDKISE